jgi:transcriptional regulator with XRE-family HTH domain
MENKRLRDLRKEKKVSQEEVAAETCITRGAYNTYELGIREPSHETTIKLAQYFDVSLNYLMGITDTRERFKPEEQPLDEVYLHFARQAQEAGLQKPDMDYIMGLYQRAKKMSAEKDAKDKIE